MKKNVVLIVAGVGDFFFGSHSNKSIDKKEKLLSNIEDIVNRGNYKAVTNLTTPHETTREVDVFKNVRPQSVVNFTLHSDELLHKNNELAILSIDNDELYQLSILIKLNLIRITNIKVQKKNKIIQIHELSSGEKSILSILSSILSTDFLSISI